jgi:hypothetical protein
LIGHWLLVADHRDTVLGMPDRHAFWAVLALQGLPRGPCDLEEVEQRRRAQEAVSLDSGPCARFGHVKETWVTDREVGLRDAHHHARRSMMLREWKRVAINDTAAPATRSIS